MNCDVITLITADQTVPQDKKGQSLLMDTSIGGGSPTSSNKAKGGVLPKQEGKGMGLLTTTSTDKSRVIDKIKFEVFSP